MEQSAVDKMLRMKLMALARVGHHPLSLPASKETPK